MSIRRFTRSEVLFAAHRGASVEKIRSDRHRAEAYGYRSVPHQIMETDSTSFGIVAGDQFIEGGLNLAKLQSHCDFLNDATPNGGVYRVVPITVSWRA